VTDQDALTDDEIASHTYMAVEGPMFTVGDVERIVAARVAQVTADRDKWKIERDAVFRGFKTALAERDALVEKIRAIRAALLQGGQTHEIRWRDAVVALDAEPAVLPSTGDHT
jgi:hypothetical protein